MNWVDFLDTADRLSQATTEGDWRSAVSRAYYAVFHYFRGFFETRGLNLGRSSQTHFNIYTGLLHSGIPAGARIGTRVDDMRDRRITADYDLKRSVDQASAVAQVAEARSLVADFRAVITTVPAAQIVAAARQHLQAIGKIVKTP